MITVTNGLQKKLCGILVLMLLNGMLHSSNDFSGLGAPFIVETQTSAHEWIGYIGDSATLPAGDGYRCRLLYNPASGRYSVIYVQKDNNPIRPVIEGGKSYLSFITKRGMVKKIAQQFIANDGVSHPSAVLQELFSHGMHDNQAGNKKDIMTLSTTGRVNNTKPQVYGPSVYSPRFWSHSTLEDGTRLVWVELAGLPDPVLVNIGIATTPTIDPVTGKQNFFYTTIKNPRVPVTPDQADKKGMLATTTPAGNQPTLPLLSAAPQSSPSLQAAPVAPQVVSVSTPIVSVKPAETTVNPAVIVGVVAPNLSPHTDSEVPKSEESASKSSAPQNQAPPTGNNKPVEQKK